MLTVTETFFSAGNMFRQMIGSAMSSVRAGEQKIVSYQPNRSGRENLIVTSSSFTDGSAIPKQFTPMGANRAPELSWSAVPSGTRELVLIVEDPDAPMPSPFAHWIVHRIPPTVQSLPAGLPNERLLSQLGGAVQGQNDAKIRGWYGPKPPLGHGLHRYHFQLFAVDTQLSLGPDATLDEISRALSGHVLADGEIVGTYERTAASSTH
jgi:Raf kinase inhibitor-like YbhB/YbcL family protein